MVGTDRLEVLNWLQEHFAWEFRRYGKLKESDIRPMDHEQSKLGQDLENILKICRTDR